MPIRVSCPECDQEYQLKDELAGKKVRCKMCQAVIPVPAPKVVVAKPKVEYDDVEFEDEKTGDPFDDEFDWEQEERRSARIKRPTRVKSKPVKKKKKKSRSDYADLDTGDRLYEFAKKALMWSVAANVAMALLIIVTGLPLLKVPAVLVLFVTILTGAVFVVVGGIWQMAIALEEDAICLVLWFFIPFYSLYYVITRWDQCSRPVILQFLGIGMFIGVALVPIAMDASL